MKTPPPEYVLAGRTEIRLKISPGYAPNSHKFTFGSCDGLFMLTRTAYVLVVIANTQPGNGTFAKLLTHLRALGQQHRRDLVVAEIHNKRLAAHLAQRHGYQLLAGGRHAFLPVAGTGTPPGPELLPGKPGPLDTFLSLLTAALN